MYTLCLYDTHTGIVYIDTENELKTVPSVCLSLSHRACLLLQAGAVDPLSMDPM